MTVTETIEQGLASFGFGERLGEEQVDALYGTLHDRFGVDFANDAQPWDRDGPHSGYKDPRGGSLMSMWIGAKPCLLLAPDSRTIWRLPEGFALAALLSEQPRFETYVCDDAASYLLCHNEFDYLIGWGEGREWVEAMAG